MNLRSIVVSQQNWIKIKFQKAQRKYHGVHNVINNVLLGGRDMRAMVMPLRSCGYSVMLTSLRESFMGGEGREMAKSRREERDNRQKSTSTE